jgi:phosphoglucomutase/phosphomannomutase
MKAVMAQFRAEPPTILAGLKVTRVRDYLEGIVYEPGGKPEPLEGPTGDMVMLDLEAEGNYVAIRPSGTEPKVKLYMFTYDPPETIANMAASKAALEARLTAMENNLRAFAGT